MGCAWCDLGYGYAVSRCWGSRRGRWLHPHLLFSSTCHCLSVATARRFLLFAVFCWKRQRWRGDGSTIMFTRRLTPRDANKQYPRQSENSCTGNAGSNRFLVCRLTETHGCSDLTTRAAIASLTKLGGKFHLNLNIVSRPTANKYHEGKVKRTLKGELQAPEIAER